MLKTMYGSFIYRRKCNKIHSIVLVSKFFSSFFQHDTRQFKTEVTMA